MRPALLIAWREYKQYVFSRGFLLFLVMFPLGAAFVAGSVSFIEKARPVRNFVVVDETGALIGALDRELARRHARATLDDFDRWLDAVVDPAKIEPDAIAPPFGGGGRTWSRVEAFEAAGGVEAGRAAVAPYLRDGAADFVPPKRSIVRLDLSPDVASAETLAEAAARLRPYLNGEKPYPGAFGGLFGAVLIPEGFAAGDDGPQPEFWTKNVTDPALESVVASALRAALQRRAAEREGLSGDRLDALSDIDVSLTLFRSDEGPDAAEVEAADRFRTAVLPAALTYMLLVIIFGVGNLLLTNTIEERSNKIVEVLLSSVTADQLMAGKLIGIGAVGLTMPTLFLLAASVTAFFGGADAEALRSGIAALFASNLIFIYLFYFFCAYSIFAMIFLAIGAMSNSLQDAQSFMGPVMLLVFAPLPFMFMVFENPNGPVATVLTFIPIYTPYAVLMRAASNPPLAEIVAATAIMLIFAAFFARIMGRIFKSALLQSAPAKARDLIRLARKT